MAANKDKTRAAAQKYLQKGQLDKAIREYQRLVEDDPKDVRTLLKIGDLQTRMGDHEKATETYSRVAQFYSDQGFFLKAVAVYKQILRLDSGLIEVNLKLADLYFQLGLMSDAANQYRSVSQLLEQQGRIEESIEIVQKMVELDPDNVASRIKLAESYAKQDRTDDARMHFQAAAEYLKSQHRIDDYIKVAERVIHFDPSDFETTRELANIYIQKNDPRRALAKLQVCFKENPKDVDTLNLLAAAFKGVGQTVKTLSVYRELGRLHGLSGNVEAQRSIMRKILAIEPNDPEAQQVLEQTEQLPDNALGRIRPAQKPVRRSSDVVEVHRAEGDLAPPSPPSDEDIGIDVDVDEAEAAAEDGAAAQARVEEQVNRILIEADVYIKYGLKSKAIEHVRKVFSLKSNHREARVRYKDLLVDTGELDTAVAELMLLATNAADAGDTQDAVSDLRQLLGYDPSHAQARELLEKLAPGESDLAAVVATEGEVPTGEGSVSAEPALSYDPSPAAADIDLDADDDVLEDADAGMVDSELILDDPLPDLPPVAPDAPPPLPGIQRDTDFDLDQLSESDAEPAIVLDDGLEDLSDEELAEPSPLGDETSDVSVRTGVSEVHFGAPSSNLSSAPASEKTMSGETEVDFGGDELEPAEPLESAAGPLPDEATPAGLDDLDALLASAVPARDAEPEVAAAPPPAAAAPAQAPPPAAVTSGESRAFDQAPYEEEEDDLSDELEEIQFFIEQGLEDEAREQLEALIAIYGERQDLLALQNKLGGEPEAPAESAPRPTVTVEDDEGIESVDVEADLAAGIDELTAGDDFQVAFQDVFDEFKKGVAEVVEEGDYQTHYDLGIAYKEMGLYDDAIREFEHAADSDEKAIGALTMMGLCALATGDSAQALSHFLRGMNSEYVTPDESLALRFEIGQAYEAMGRLREAMKFYEKVESLDPEFREVGDRLLQVRSQIDGEDAAIPEGLDGELDELLMETEAERNAREKGDKISYI